MVYISLDTLEKDTTHLCYHRFRGEHFIKTLKAATTRSREWKNSEKKSMWQLLFFVACHYKKQSWSNGKKKLFNPLSIFWDCVTVYTRHCPRRCKGGNQGGCVSSFVKNILRRITNGKIVNVLRIFKSFFSSFSSSIIGEFKTHSNIWKGAF